MNHLSPSILAADFGALRKDVLETVNSGADYIHIDIMDGVFVPNLSIGFPVIESLRAGVDCVFDVHLMITEPERYVERFVKAGSDIITFHVESTADPLKTAELIRKCGAKVGVSVKPGTGVEAIEAILPLVDMVLVMTVEPGFGGQKFMPDMLEKVKKLASMRAERELDFDIEVDGGVGLSNIKDALNAGANVFVVGSGVFSGGSISENTAALCKVIG